jgi:hypothetical protein
LEQEFKITFTYRPSTKREDAVLDWGWGEVDDYITLYMEKKKVTKGMLETTRIVFLNDGIESIKIEKTTFPDKKAKVKVVNIKKESESK